MSPKKKPNKTVLFIIAFILGSIFLFCFLIFETSAIYDVDISNYYNLNQEVHRPISVSEIQRQIEMADNGITEGPGPIVNLGSPGTLLPSVGGGNNPGDTGSSGTDPDNTVTVTPAPDSIGSKVTRICSDSVYIYDGPTVNASGNFVYVEDSFERHDKSVNNWVSIEFGDIASVTPGVQARFTNMHADSLGVCCDDVAGVNGVTERYAVALGPGIMNPGRIDEDKATPQEMRYGTPVDVVLERDGVRYYVPVVVVDCVAHTYPTGMIYTGYRPEGGGDLTFTDRNGNWTYHATYDPQVAATEFDTAGVVEFVHVPGSGGCSEYSLIGLIVY